MKPRMLRPLDALAALFSAILALGGLAAPASAGADEDLGAVFDVCAGADNAACGAAMWSFVDVTGDDRLTSAELTRFLRVMSERTVAEQAGAAAGLGLGAGLDEEMGRTGAVAMAFLVGPFTAKLIVDNFDYNGNGMLERGEVFADTDESAFVVLVKTQMEKLPQYAMTAFMAAMAAQEQAGFGDKEKSAPPPASAPPLVVPAPKTAVEPAPEPVEQAPPKPQALFSLRNVDEMLLFEGDAEIIVVSDEIVNLSDQTLVAPVAIAQALDANRGVLKTWRFTPSPSELRPGETAGFVGRLDGAPPDTVDWTVVLEGGE